MKVCVLLSGGMDSVTAFYEVLLQRTGRQLPKSHRVGQSRCADSGFAGSPTQRHASHHTRQVNRNTIHHPEREWADLDGARRMWVTKGLHYAAALEENGLK